MSVSRKKEDAMRSQTVKFLSFILMVSILLAACGPAATPEPEVVEVEQTVIVEVEKEITRIVEGTPVVETVVETVVEVVTATPEPTMVPEPKILRVGALEDSYEADPELPGREGIAMWPLNVNVYEGLVRFDNEYQLQPLLAESWEYDEEREVWTFHLRQGVTFHDGTPFNAEAVVETFKLYSTDYLGPRLQIDETSTTAIDEYTVEMKTPYRQVPDQISHPMYGMRNPKADPFAGELWGTGPFRVVEYVPDDHILVERNPDYWGEPAKIDQVLIRFMPDANTRVLALQAGEIDIAYELPLESVATLAVSPGVKLVQSEVSAYSAVALIPTYDAPYNLMVDRRVREAVAYAIDRPALIDAVFDGLAVDSQTYIPYTLLAEHASLIQGFTYDPDRSRTLLDEAGWVDTDGDGIREKDGRDLAPVLLNGYPSADRNGTTAEEIQAQLREVGIAVEIVNSPDTATTYEVLGNEVADMYVEQGNQNSASMCFLPYILFYGQEEPNVFAKAVSPYFVGYEDVNVELDNCQAAFDPNVAARWAAEAMHTVIDEAITEVPLAGIFRVWGLSDRVQGFTAPQVHVNIRYDTITLP
jgi:peptide/nickel transport system substrate-binding protein